MANIIANFSHYIIPEYEIGDCPKLEKMLAKYDKRRFQMKIIGFVYDSEKQEMRIPRGFPEATLKKLLKRPIIVNTEPSPYDSIKMDLTRKPREELQLRVIAFFCGKGKKYQYTEKHSQLFCDLDTGKGKTYCATATITHFKHKAVIFVPSMVSKVSDQWVSGILDSTNLKSKSILQVDGSKGCLQILDGKHADVDIFIFTRATALSFAKKHGWDKFQEMIAATKAGIKIVDEAHMDFETNVKIDCYTNIKRNFYLTSSVGRGDIWEDKIFNHLFDSVPVIGKDLKKAEDNYTIITIMWFNHTPTTKQRLNCKTKDGLSAVLYSDYLIDPNGAKYEFFTAINKTINMFFIKYRKGESKLLILGATRKLLIAIQKFLSVNFGEYSVGLYTSDTPKKVRHLELERDIILATEKGMGTGSDVPDLQFMINTIPYSNKIYADQLNGRLRFIKDKQVFYTEIANASFPETKEQVDKRLPHLGKKAKDGRIISIVSE